MSELIDARPRRAERDSPLLILASRGEVAERLAAQFQFLDLEVAVVSSDGLLEALHGIAAPLGLVVTGAAEGESVRALLERVIELRPELPLILYEGVGQDAEFDDLPGGRLMSALREPVRYSTLAQLVRDLRLVHAQAGPRAGERPEIFRSLVGRSAGIDALRRMVMRVAPWEATVMLRGETGTGKEVVARNIHYYSARRAGPFVAVNCGAIPADLLESELFGHERGAFTGALTTRRGRFELAAGGTLFLDEIGDMPVDMQVKLLRVLQERRFEPLGGTRTVEADVRIVAATHRNLEDMIAVGRFREDLYYRLNVVPMEVPALRERREDLPLLITELQARLQRLGMPTVRFENGALLAMLRYEWPGNVRELANLVERCAILAPDREVRLADLPERLRALGDPADPTPLDVGLEALVGTLGPIGLPAEGGGLSLKNLLDDIEMRLIRQALDSCEGVVARAAKLLGLRRTTLVEKMRKFRIDRWDEATEF